MKKTRMKDRAELKLLLGKCTIDQQKMFIAMYSKEMGADVSRTVDLIPAKNLDWATKQACNSLHTNLEDTFFKE